MDFIILPVKEETSYPHVASAITLTSARLRTCHEIARLLAVSWLKMYIQFFISTHSLQGRFQKAIPSFNLIWDFNVLFQAYHPRSWGNKAIPFTHLSEWFQNFNLMASRGGTLLGYQVWSQPQQEGEQQIQIQIHKDRYSNNLTTTLISTLTSWCYHPLCNDLGVFQDLPNSCRFQATEFGNKATKKNSTH